MVHQEGVLDRRRDSDPRRVPDHRIGLLQSGTRLIVLENDKQDRKEYFNRYEAKSDDQFKEISRKLDKLTEVWLSREARALIQDQNSMAGMGGNGRR